MTISKDIDTAQAFATSWNNLPPGSIYTFDQFEDWMKPLCQENIENKDVLELGCGNASLLVHLTKWNPKSITGVDLGDSVISAKNNLSKTNFRNHEIVKGDLTEYASEQKYDITYSIGVLHHLQEPKKGFDSVIKNTKDGGRFHCWVYAKEGNSVIIYIVDPIRKIVSSLPWWFTKYFVAAPLAFFYFLYAHSIVLLRFGFMPLYDYSRWICKRGFLFFRHVAFDQLVTPQTTYIDKITIENWLKSDNRIAYDSTYIIMRNGNSWKFGGIRKSV